MFTSHLVPFDRLGARRVEQSNTNSWPRPTNDKQLLTNHNYIQNTICCTVRKLSQFSHVTPFLHKLHWFLIQHLILFKYNLITCMTINFSQPPYLSDLIKHCDLTRGNRLSVSSTRPNKRMGSHSFAAAANTKWNKLPQTIRTQDSINGFRQQLKTYLFRIIILPNWTLKWIWTIFFGNWTIPS